MTRLTKMFRSTVRVTMTVLLIGAASGQAWAEPVRSWVLETQSGQVRLVKTGITPIALTVGDAFAGGDWIETGPDGRAVLRRGEETIVVAPNSRIGLPRENTGPFATRILQTLGAILLTVEKKTAQHFEVQTPYLTAVVKGTTFTVGIEGERAVVHVVEGLVEVKNLASGRSSLVHPGQTGAVVRGGAADVQVDGGVGKAGGKSGRDTPSQARNDAKGAGQAASKAPAGAPRGNPGKVTIKQAFGPDTLNLTESTNGLVRAADRAVPHAAAGRPAGANPGPGQGKGLAARQGLTANPGIGNAKGLAVGRALSANPGLGNAKGLAARQGLTANPGLGNAKGLAVGRGLSANPGLGNGSRPAAGQGRNANPGLANAVAAVTANGNGLAVGLGLNPNPANVNVNANANGNSNGKGHGRSHGKGDGGK